MQHSGINHSGKSAALYFAFIVGFAVLVALSFNYLINKGQQDVLRTINNISQSTIPGSLQNIKNTKHMEDLLLHADVAITTDNEIKEKEAIGSIYYILYISNLDAFSPLDEYIKEIQKLVGDKRRLSQDDLDISWSRLKNRIRNHIEHASAGAFVDIDSDLGKASDAMGSMRNQINVLTFAIMALSLLVMAAIYIVFIRPLAHIERLANDPTVDLSGDAATWNRRIATRVREMAALSDAVANLHATTLENTKIRQCLEVQMEEAAIAVEEKSDFLASMSHEIRTPLSSIAGMIYLLEKSNLSESQAKYTSLLARSCNHLNQIVNRSLDVSRLNAYKLDLIHEEVSLNQLVDEVTEMVKPVLKSKHIELGVDIDESVPAVLVGDSVRLKEILINYLNNAVKFTQIGRIDVVLRCLVLNQETVTIKMAVKDTGVGIAAENVAMLFTRFSQFGKRQFAGSGLGLAITQGLARLMGGSVGVETREGVGSTFWAIVVLDMPHAHSTPGVCKPSHVRHESGSLESRSHGQPDRDAPDSTAHVLSEVMYWARKDSPKAVQLWLKNEQAISQALQAKATVIGDLLRAYQLPQACAAMADMGVVCTDDDMGVETTKPCALIIDDTPHNLEFMHFLIHDVASVKVAASAQHGLDIALSGADIALVVLDISMPCLDGLEVLRRIKANPVSASIPVVMMSAFSDHRTEEKCVLLGAAEYVDRGASPDALKKTLMKYLPTEAS